MISFIFYIICSSLFGSILYILIGNNKFMTPKYIYNHSKCNWFGTILIFILTVLLAPIYVFFLFIIWLCTIGR
jgi:hypothetical protein